MYETFVSTYKEANPNTEITELDLFALIFLITEISRFQVDINVAKVWS